MATETNIFTPFTNDKKHCFLCSRISPEDWETWQHRHFRSIQSHVRHNGPPLDIVIITLIRFVADVFMEFNVPKEHWGDERHCSGGLRINYDCLCVFTVHLNLKRLSIFVFRLSRELNPQLRAQQQNAVATEPSRQAGFVLLYARPVTECSHK